MTIKYPPTLYKKKIYLRLLEATIDVVVTMDVVVDIFVVNDVFMFLVIVADLIIKVAKRGGVVVVADENHDVVFVDDLNLYNDNDENNNVVVDLMMEVAKRVDGAMQRNCCFNSQLS